MEVVRNASYAPVSWKNGGGVTREVAVFPIGASIDDFIWRVSIADVSSSRPFSRFEGVDRSLIVLQGCLQLTWDDCDIVLGAQAAPHSFAGDLAIVGTPIDGAVRDLNVMVRRGQCRSEVHRYEAGAVIGMPAQADAALLMAATEIIVNGETGIWRLEELDTLRLMKDSRTLVLHTGKAYLIAFFRENNHE